MAEELGKRPLLPSVVRLKEAGIPVALVYGTHDVPVPLFADTFQILHYR